MKEARLGRWNTFLIFHSSFYLLVEMKEARLGRWNTLIYLNFIQSISSVEMKEARLGRWNISRLFFGNK